MIRISSNVLIIVKHQKIFLNLLANKLKGVALIKATIKLSYQLKQVTRIDN